MVHQKFGKLGSASYSQKKLDFRFFQTAFFLHGKADVVNVVDVINRGTQEDYRGLVFLFFCPEF
ncbi:MAG: hypothetical protein QNJ74_04400 [Trichodesmium sp. MO_231.B1]|nr:hypothetical protein [Trichodesmium sp. MO_231.B1]